MKLIHSLQLGILTGILSLTAIHQSTTFTTAQTTANPRNPRTFIGYQYQETPKIQGLQVLGSSMLGGGAVKNMQGGYAQVRQGQKNMLWLLGTTSKTPQNPQDKLNWQVLDSLEFSRYDSLLNSKKYHLGWGGRCRTNGQSNGEVVAVVVLENKGWLSNVKQAWRINRKTGKFLPTSVRGISCENPHLG